MTVMRFFTLLSFVIICWPDPLLAGVSPEEAVHLSFVIRIPVGFLFMFLLIWQLPDDLRALRKRMGNFPTIWDSYQSSILHFERDAAGWITDLVYNGEDRESHDQLYARWNSQRGTVWQVAGSISGHFATVLQDTLVAPLFQERVVQAFDIHTGKSRFRHSHTDALYGGDTAAWVKNGLITYLFETGAWTQLDPSTGQTTATGQLEDIDATAPLSTGSVEPVPRLRNLAGYEDDHIFIAPRDWPEIVVKLALTPQASNYAALTLEGYVDGPGLLTTIRTQHADDISELTSESQNVYAWRNPTPMPPTKWSINLAANFKYLRFNTMHAGWFANEPVLCIRAKDTGVAGQNSKVHFLWLIDCATGTPLLQLSHGAGSWIATAEGRKEIAL